MVIYLSNARIVLLVQVCKKILQFEKTQNYQSRKLKPKAITKEEAGVIRAFLKEVRSEMKRTPYLTMKKADAK